MITHMLGTVLAQTVTGNSVWTDILYNASGPVVVGMVLTAILTKRLVLPRELETLEARLKAAEEKRDRWESIAFQALHVGETVADAIGNRVPK
jgi:hypothetical protein